MVDECKGPGVARWLREHNHEVFSVYEEGRGMDDDTIVRKAFSENRILITNDKDFGEKIYERGSNIKDWFYCGLRMNDLPPRLRLFIGCWNIIQTN